MQGYARIVTGVQALAPGLELPPEMQAFVDEVRQRDARMVERRRDELAFVQKAEMHCHRQPLLKWAAEERGLPVSDLPEHAAWLAEGAALEEAGRRMQETPGFVGRIAAALGRIAQGFRLDEGERFREAAARHEAEAQRLGIDPGRHGGGGAAGPAGGSAGAPRAARSRPPDGGGVDLGTRSACPGKGASAAPGSRGGRPPDRGVPAGLPALLGGDRACGRRRWTQRIDAAEVLRRRGAAAARRGRRSEARRSGTHPAVPRSRRTRTGARGRGRAGGGGAGAPLAGRSWSSAGASPRMASRRTPIRSTCRHGGLCGIAPRRSGARRGLHRKHGRRSLRCSPAVLARDARVEAEIAPVRAFLEEGALHLDRRAALDEGVRGLAPPSPDAIPDWRERSQGLRETALNLLGESPADTRETQAAARLADMPRLQGRVREVLDRLETLELRDEVADFQKLAATVKRRARRQETLPLYAAGYRHDNRDGADPREPRGLAGSGRP